jgi:UDP-N-acetylglucosamine 2-epimerase (non-hydrolysing)
MMFTILLVFGTRPEAIKLAPVYNEMIKRRDRIRVVCCATGQHRNLLDQVLETFNLRTDYDLNLLIEDQDLFHIIVKTLEGVRSVLIRENPDMVMVQGDTSSAFSAALAGAYSKIPIAHVEAGLRSHNRFQPFPEEINRTLISRVADLNFCPTERAAEQLRREQVRPDSIHVTGNTVVDVLVQTLGLLDDPQGVSAGLHTNCFPPGRLILVTGHRRESFGQGIANLANALLDLVQTFPDVVVVYSAHPNPQVRKPVEEIVGSHERILVIDPPPYFAFIHLMRQAYFIITDSGGIQEEAPSLKKPVLVARNVTERSEAIESGAAILVGTDRKRIVQEASRLLVNAEHYASMIIKDNPFGDGHASERIVDLVESFLRRHKKRV